MNTEPFPGEVHASDCGKEYGEECSCPPKQNIWRTVSDISHNGVFVWEVYEFVPYKDNVIPPKTLGFVQCLDGTYIYPACSHHFTIEKAQEQLNDLTMESFGAVYHTI